MSSALREDVEATLTLLELLRELARRPNSTNMIERLMKEIKQRTKKVGPFPNEAANYRLAGAVQSALQDHRGEEETPSAIPGRD